MQKRAEVIGDQRGAHTGFTSSLSREHGYEPLRVEGALPEALRGTLVRNGPGLFELFGRPYAHPFEADGALLAVRLGEGRAEGAHRVVVSDALAEERRRGRPLFGTNAGQLSRSLRGLRGQMKNSANTSVAYWQGRLLALYEGGLPTEVSLDDLHTVGTTDLGGLVQGTLSAHPHRVPSRRATYNFGQRIGRETFVDVYELPDAGAARRITSFALPHAAMLHDFIATDTHLVFFVSPIWMQVFRALLRLGDLRDYFRWTPEDGTEVVIVPIDEPQAITRFHVDAFHTWHFANAYDDGAEIVVDYVHYPDLASLDEIARPGAPVCEGILSRVRLDTVLGRASERQPLCSLPCEFPTVDPRHAARRLDAIWITSDDTRCAVARVDPEAGTTRVWALDEGHRPSEALVVPSADGPGWVLTLVYDVARHESYVAVLEADRPEAGPIARVWLGHHVPITFHGIFIPQA